MDIHIRKISVHYSSGPEIAWVIYKSGEWKTPLLALSDFEMKKLVEQVTEAETGEEGKS